MLVNDVWMDTFWTSTVGKCPKPNVYKQVEAGRSARSVETLAVQVSSATRELDGLQEKVHEFRQELSVF